MTKTMLGMECVIIYVDEYAEISRCVISQGSDVLIEQAQEYSKEMPYFTTIVQRGNYYTMS